MLGCRRSTAAVVIAVGVWTLVGRAGLDAQTLLQSQAQAEANPPAPATADTTSNTDDPGPSPAIERVRALNDQTPACCQNDDQ